MTNLSPQREKFAQEVAKGKTQSDAYRIAYPKSLEWKDEAVWTAASKLMADGKVLVRVAELADVMAEIAELDGAEIIREIKRVAQSDIAGIMHEDGRVKLPHELDAATRAAVASFEIDEYGRIKYKFWDKNSALDKAAKIKGLYEKDNSQKVDPLIALIGGLGGSSLGVVKNVDRE